MADAVPSDPLAAALDLPVDPARRFHRYFRLVDWSSVPADDLGAERIKALLSVGCQGLWPRHEVWDWSGLGEQWHPTAWDETFVERIRVVAAEIAHPQIRAMLLAAVWVSGMTPRHERRDLGRNLADAHLEWARLVSEAEEFTTAWIHYTHARNLLALLGFREEAKQVEESVAVHALRLLAAANNRGVGAADVVGACCETKTGPLVSDQQVEQVLDALLTFAEVAGDYTWATNALGVAEALHRHVGRDSKVLAELRVARAIREAEERAAKGDGALVEQHFLQIALQVVVDNGLGRSIIDSLNERIRDAGQRVADELKGVRHEFKISPEMRAAIDAFLDAVRSAATTKPTAALHFAAYEQAIPLATVERAHQSRGASLLDLIHGQALVGDRLGGALTAERRVLGDYVRIYQTIPLSLLNTALLAVEEVAPDALEDTLCQCPAARDRGDVALREGVRAYSEERYAAAVYLLLPELEALVRAVVRDTGRPRTAYTRGRQREHTLSTLVATLREALPPQERKIADFLSAIISDEDGFNLRNNALHGIIDPAHIGRGEALIVLHGLLLVAGLTVGAMSCALPEEREE